MAGMDGIVHLAGIASEAPFEDILSVNIEGTWRVLETARRAGVVRVVYASSNHAVGFTPRVPMVGIDIPPRPDTYYGLSKVFGEALGRLYTDRYGVSVACLRIGSCTDRPTTRRMLSRWLSPGDAVRLVHACLTSPKLGYALVYGISDNTRAWWDLGPARALGYEPHDDAEEFAGQVLGADQPPDPDDPEEKFLGGRFVQMPADDDRR
jgi:uronate dehydrogenase